MTTQKCLIVTENAVLKEMLSNYILSHNNLELLPSWDYGANHEDSPKDIDILFLDVKRNVQSTLKVLLLYFNRIDHLVWIAEPEDFKNSPISRNGLYRLKTPVTIEKLHELIESILDGVPDYRSPIQTKRPKDIFVRSSEKSIGYVHCSLSEITVIEVMDKTLMIHTAERGIISTYFPIAKIESKLGEEYFIRVHRSFIISKKYIDRISGNIVHMLKYGPELKIGKKYQDRVNTFIHTNLLSL